MTTKITKHTPGPWNVSQQQGLRLFIADKDEVLAEILRCAWDDEQFANARLIAAAPAMLEALEIALKCAFQGTGRCDQCQEMAKAAIRLAVERQEENAQQ